MTQLQLCCWILEADYPTGFAKTLSLLVIWLQVQVVLDFFANLVFHAKFSEEMMRTSLEWGRVVPSLVGPGWATMERRSSLMLRTMTFGSCLPGGIIHQLQLYLLTWVSVLHQLKFISPSSQLYALGISIEVLSEISGWFRIHLMAFLNSHRSLLICSLCWSLFPLRWPEYENFHENILSFQCNCQ